MTFSAVILAGGKSSRMGRDKAWLQVGGQTLLARQIGVAQAAGATEVFISGRSGLDYSAFGCAVLEDQFIDAGPLSGIERALAVGMKPLLLVLAVDLPAMNAGLLRRLSAAAGGLGVIPRLDGHLEPLAAFYPRAAHALLRELLIRARPPTPALSRKTRENPDPTSGKFKADGDIRCMIREASTQPLAPHPGRKGQDEGVCVSRKFPSVKQFAGQCVQSGLARYFELTQPEAHCFNNWNSPADLQLPGDGPPLYSKPGASRQNSNLSHQVPGRPVR